DLQLLPLSTPDHLGRKGLDDGGGQQRFLLDHGVDLARLFVAVLHVLKRLAGAEFSVHRYEPRCFAVDQRIDN
ncbi:hypothetical protein TSAR_011268, partial [Trichomalopsis sarcophagae]